MSYFSDIFNPFLHGEITKIIPSKSINHRLRCSNISRTSTNLLQCALDLLVVEVENIEKQRGLYATHTLHALDILGALQSELNLHAAAAATYLKIVTIDDVQEYKSLPLPQSGNLRWYRPLRPQRRYERNLVALFNLSLHLNKSNNFIEAEVALRRLIPYTRAKHGCNSWQYRNAIEQLIYALLGQGCKAGVQELWVEYQRSQDDEIIEMLHQQDLSPSDSDDNYLADIDIDTASATGPDTDTELDAEAKFLTANAFDSFNLDTNAETSFHSGLEDKKSTYTQSWPQQTVLPTFNKASLFNLHNQ